MNIGRPQRIIEVEPVSLPLPEPVTAPTGPRTGGARPGPRRRTRWMSPLG